MCLFSLVVCRVVIEVPSLSVLLQLALRRLPGLESLFRGTQRGPLPGCTSAKLGTLPGCGVFPGGMPPEREGKPGPQLIGFATEGQPGAYRGFGWGRSWWRRPNHGKSHLLPAENRW